MTSLPASASRLSIDGHGDTCEPWGPWHDDQLARRWPCPPSIVGTLPDPGVSFPPSIVGTLAGVDRRHRGDRGTMTSFAGAGLARRRSSARCQAPADWPASIIGTAGTVAR